MSNGTLPEGNSGRAQKAGILVLSILVLFGVIAFTIINRQTADAPKPSDNSSDRQSSGTKLHFEADGNELTVGQSSEVSVWLDTGSDAINSVEAFFSYPANLLEIDEVDTKSSKFDTVILADANDGTVRLALGTSKGNLSGKLLVATIKLTARATGNANLTFTDSSAAVRTNDQNDPDSIVDVLKRREPMTLNIKAE